MRSSEMGPDPSEDMKKAPFQGFLQKLRKRRIIETLAAFIGGGWLLVEVVERLLVSHYHLPDRLIDLTVVSVIGALLATLAWRWFRSADKRPGNVKIEVLFVPLISLVALAIDLAILLKIAWLSRQDPACGCCRSLSRARLGHPQALAMGGGPVPIVR